MNISVVGLGKLGSCMAAVYASKGHTVVGIDLNQKYVDAFNNHQAPVQEKDLAEYIERYGERLKGTTEYSSAIAESVMTFIIVPTPTDETAATSS
jgi:UDPglucose 6-dehydrogenase